MSFQKQQNATNKNVKNLSELKMTFVHMHEKSQFFTDLL